MLGAAHQLCTSIDARRIEYDSANTYHLSINISSY